MNKNNTHADLKLPLIDLEADNTATGGKQDNSVQPERLSEEDSMYCVYWIKSREHSNIKNEGYVGITRNFKERMRAHKKNKYTTKLTSAIKKYGFTNLDKIILYENLTLKEALRIENELRPNINIGWNLQSGGFIGVEPSWYDNEKNKLHHKKRTSEETKKAIKKKDSHKSRSERAKISNAKHKDKYKEALAGEKNPRAILSEDNVKEIKFKLFKDGYSNREIAQIFNVKTHVIYQIRIGKNWKHIVCDSPDHDK